jgi:hypothetical protein
MPTPVEAGNGKVGVFLKPVPGLVSFSEGAAPPVGCNFVPVFRDTFMDTNGVRLDEHTPDITSSDWGWVEGGGAGSWNTFGVQVEIQGNRAVVPVGLGGGYTFGYADLYSTTNYGDLLPLTYPYRVTMIGRHAPASTGLVGHVQLVLQDDNGTDNALYIRLYDTGGVYTAEVTQYVETVANQVSTPLGSNAEATIVVTVNDGSIDVTVNGSPLTSITCATKLDWTYAQMEVTRADSYMELIDISVCE